MWVFWASTVIFAALWFRSFQIAEAAHLVSSCAPQMVGGKPKESCAMSSCANTSRQFFVNDETIPGDSEFPVDITIFPFVNTTHPFHRIRSAINVTFTLSEPGIERIAFRVQSECSEYPFCRVLDVFRGSDVDFPVTHWNGEYYFIGDDHSSIGRKRCFAFYIDVTTVPNRHGTKRFVFNMPEATTIDCGIPLMVVDSRSKSLTTMLASTCLKGSEHKTTNLTVMMTGASFVESQRVNTWCGNKTVLKWNSIEPAPLRTFHLRYLGLDSNCSNLNIRSLQLTFPYERGIQAWIIVAISMFFVGNLMIALICTKRRKPEPWGLDEKKPKVFVVYSHDVQQHSSVVETFASYLKARCHVDVILDKWDLQRQSPLDWVQTSLRNGDFIFIVWSRGARLKASDPGQKLITEPDHLGGDLFTLTYNMIKLEVKETLSSHLIPFHSHNVLTKFCHVHFPYDTRVPCNDLALRYASEFDVPKDLDRLVQYVHGQHASRLTRCCLGCQDLSLNDVKCSVEGKAFLDAVAVMERFERDNPDWFSDIIKVASPTASTCLLEAESCLMGEGERIVGELPSDKSEDEGPIALLDDDDSDDHTNFPPPIHSLPVFGEEWRAFDSKWEQAHLSPKQVAPNLTDIPRDLMFGSH